MAKEKNLNTGISIEIPEAIINDKVIGGLTELFQMSPPYYLRKSVNDLFFSYMCNTEPEDYDPKMKEIATDVCYLIKFLEKAELESKGKAK